MATISKTIASSGGDYTSLSLAEASIPGSGTDDYVFTYIEALSDTTPVTISFGATNTMTVDVQEAYRCNGAVSGSHAELVYAVADATATILNTGSGNVTINNLRIERDNGNDNFALCFYRSAGNGLIKLDGCTIIRRCAGGVDSGFAIYDYPDSATAIMTICNCFIVDAGRNNAASGCVAAVANSRMQFFRNTVFMPDGTSLALIRSAAAICDARENVVLKAAGATCATVYLADSGGSFSGDSTNNVSSDTTAPGSSPMTNKAAADLLTTLTVGSEDLHYPTRAAMLTLTEGADLSATTGTVDIDGDTIEGWYPGADYVIGPPTVTDVTPSSGPAAGGTNVTVSGTNFTGATGVTFGGTAATNVSVASEVTLTCDTPAHAAGAVSVVVTTPSGSNEANTAFTYNAAAATAQNTGGLRLGLGLGL